jgi:hypothetical protein
MHTDPGKMDDQRGLPRKKVGSSIRIVSEGNAMMSGMAIDLSESGLGLLLPYAIPTEKEYAFEFEVALNTRKKKIRISGAAIYFEPYGVAGFRTGIRISEVHPTSLMTFIHFMES